MDVEKLRRLREDLDEQKKYLNALGLDAELPDGVALTLKGLFADIQAALPGQATGFIWQFHDRVAVALSQISTAMRKLDEATAEVASGDPGTEGHPERFETAFAVCSRTQQLGEGGAGYVYEVQDEDGRRYALIKPLINK